MKKIGKERLEREKVEKQELEYDKENPIFDGISHFYEHVEYEHNSEIDKKLMKFKFKRKIGNRI